VTGADLSPAPAARVTAALAECGRGNALLTFAGHDAGHSSGGHSSGGQAAGDFDDAAPGLVDEVSRWLGVRERRVAASLVVLGYAARLVGPSAAMLLCHGIMPDCRPAAVRFDFAAGRGFRLSLPAPAGWQSDDADALYQRWRDHVLDDHLAMVIGAVRHDTPVAPGLLWGNVASGLLGALAALVRAGATAPTRCADLAAEALAAGPLAGSGELTVAGDVRTFRRRSCCLYYRLPGGGYCGDCCFTGRITQ